MRDILDSISTHWSIGHIVTMSHAEIRDQAMVCAECFRAKGGRDPIPPCHNPKCYFFLQTPTSQLDTKVNSLCVSFSQGLNFSKEVGCDRGRKLRPSYCTDVLLSPSKKDTLWGYHPTFTLSQKLPQSFTFTNNRVRSQSTSDSRILRPTRADEKAIEQTRLMRARMASMPTSVGPILLDDDSDLVEDAFLNSPLPPEFREENRLGTPDTTDSGIGSPFGKTSSMLDWFEPLHTQTSTYSTVGVLDMPASKQAAAGTRRTLHSTSTVLLPSDTPASGSRRTLHSSSAVLHLGDTYSRKVFIGGLPQDIDEDDIRTFFQHFGLFTVDWPHKGHNKSSTPPKGYAFLLFKEESSVHKLLLSCMQEGSRYFLYIPTTVLGGKKVQIRPWSLSDSKYVGDSTHPLDSRKAVFVGGVPRPLRASELAEVMKEKYGNVVFVAIDCDGEFKYPKGAACVVFSSHASYIAAVSARFMQLNYGNLDKKIELKPYVMDNQVCDECHGVQCNGKPAPFFCGSVTCLQYYCEYCWATVHSMPDRQNHRPLLKDIGDKARLY